VCSNAEVKLKSRRAVYRGGDKKTTKRAMMRGKIRAGQRDAALAGKGFQVT